MLEINEQEFKTTTINMVRALMDNVDSMQKQVNNVSREMGILRASQKLVLKIKNTITRTSLMGLVED